MNKLNEVKPGHGVYEWARYSYNIGTGCVNDCCYCYAREIALRTGMVANATAWSTEVVKPGKANIQQSADDIVMFPTMHDISENYLPTYLEALRNLLKAGNRVVIVTKPRLASIRAICREFAEYRDYMLFRMTITSLNDELSRFWEPGAPLPEERVQSLRHAFDAGFQTSVSVEPMLDTVQATTTLYHSLAPYLTEDIWFGKMNGVRGRVDRRDQVVANAVQTTTLNQSDVNILWLYNQLKNQPKVAWKDSIREVVGTIHAA